MKPITKRIKRSGSNRTNLTLPRRPGGKGGRDNDVSWHSRFLDSLRVNRFVSTACRVAGVTRNAVYDHRARFPDFAAAWADTRRELGENIEAGFFNRAVNGVTVKKFTSQGNPIIDPKTKKQYEETVFNETAVLRALATLIPEVWREKIKVESTTRVMSDEEILKASQEAEEWFALTLLGGQNGMK